MSDNLEKFDCIIIGSGSAGTTAGLYLSRGNVKNLLLTGEQIGGLLTTTDIVENYPGCFPAVSGPQLMEIMIKQSKHYGTDVRYETCTKITNMENYFIVETNSKKYKCKSVIFATGSSHRKLNIPGEKEFENLGVSYCAVCDGFLYRNKSVIVVGGGNSAMEEALFLSNLADKVFLVHRRNQFRGEKILHDRVLQKSNITILWDSILTEIHGTKKLESVSIKNVTSEEIVTHSIDGVFIAIGHIPNTSLVEEFITTDQEKYIVSNHSKTNVPGFFVAGDVFDKIYRQAVTAAASGCIAALEVMNYLNK